jgi:hypothetical protein
MSIRCDQVRTTPLSKGFSGIADFLSAAHRIGRPVHSDRQLVHSSVPNPTAAARGYEENGGPAMNCLARGNRKK